MHMARLRAVRTTTPHRMVWSLLLFAALTGSSNCPAADPNDDVPDDAALNACLQRNATLLLDPPNLPGRGYLLSSSLLISQNGSRVQSSQAPRQAVLLAHAELALPMVTTGGTIVGLSLLHLRLDGAPLSRNVTLLRELCSSASGAANGNYKTSNVLLPGFSFPSPPTWRCWDPWQRYVSGVELAFVTSTGSPCGAGVGISGRGYRIHDNEVLSNGFDLLHNPLRLDFPYADGLNLAVCAEATVEDNVLIDNSNMVIAVGPGPYCLVRNNSLLQRAGVSQNGINVWPTNVGQPSPWWHPEPWSFAHSAVVGNAVAVASPAPSDVGMFSGIAVGGIPWASYATLPSGGLVLNNTVDGAHVGLLVDGVREGTVYGNRVLSVGAGGEPTNCPAPQFYTVADAVASLLQEGYNSTAFRQGPCAAVPNATASTFDNATFVRQEGAADVACGAALNVSWTFLNTGSSLWEDYALPSLGVGAAPAAGWWAGAPLRAPPLRGTRAAPGSEATFAAALTAPAAPGRFHLQVGLVGVRGPFGQRSAPLAVEVRCGGGAPRAPARAPPPPTPAQALQAAIDAAIAARAPAFTIPSAAYDFGRSNFVVKSAVGLSVGLAPPGANFTFFPGFGVVVADSSRVSLGGGAPLTVGYSPPCHAQGLVTAVAPGTPPAASLDVRLEAGFPLPNATFFDSSEIKLMFYDAAGERRRVVGQAAFQPARVVGEVAPGVWRFAAVGAGWASFTPSPGMLCTVSPRVNTSGFVIPDYYGGNALSVYGSASVAVRGVALLGSGNFGVLEWGGEGAHTYEGLRIARAEGSLLSTNCDGFHSFACGTGGALVDSDVSFTGDDVVNFHNRAALLLRSNATTGEVLLADVGDVVDHAGAVRRALADVGPGDALEVYQAGQLGAFVGTLRALGPLSLEDDPALLVEARALVAAAIGAGRANPGAVAVWRGEVRVVGAAAPLVVGQALLFPRRASARGALRNVTATDVYDSCGRLQASGVAYEGSSCARSYSGLSVQYDWAFLEGSRGLQNISVVGNAFAAVGDPPARNMSQVIHADPDVAGLVVENNTVSPAAERARV